MQRIEFYDGTRLLNSDSNSADGWIYVWSNVSAGTYSLTAKAIDDKGAQATTSPLAIRVVEPGALQCSGTEPGREGVIKGASNYTEGAAVTTWTYDDSANGTISCKWRCDRSLGYKRADNKCVYQNKLTRSDLTISQKGVDLVVEETDTKLKLLTLDNINQTEASADKLEIEKNNLNETSAYLIIRNLTLSGKTKIIYLKPLNANANAVCIADRENIQSVEDIRANCLQVRCPSSLGEYSCEVSAGEFAVKGLKHSGVIEQTVIDQPPAGGGNKGGSGGGDYVPPKTKEKGKENATLPKVIPQPEKEEEKETGEFKNATLADKIQKELEKRIKNKTARVIVSIAVIGALIAGIIIMFVVVWRRVSKDKMPGLSENAGVRIK